MVFYYLCCPESKIDIQSECMAGDDSSLNVKPGLSVNEIMVGWPRG